MRSATRLTINNHFHNRGNVSHAPVGIARRIRGYPSYTPRPNVKQTAAIARI